MGLFSSLEDWPPAVRYGLIVMIVGIPVVSIGLIIWNEAREDDGQLDPTYEPSLVQVFDLCHSMVELTKQSAPRLDKAEERIESKSNCEIPGIQVDPCDGEPEVGHIQIRSCTDIIKVEFEGRMLYGTGCPELLSGVEYDDTIELHPTKPGTGVAYWDFFNGQPMTPEHILLHGIGFGWGDDINPEGHSTRASSVMFPTAGLSFDDIHCD